MKFIEPSRLFSYTHTYIPVARIYHVSHYTSCFPNDQIYRVPVRKEIGRSEREFVARFPVPHGNHRQRRRWSTISGDCMFAKLLAADSFRATGVSVIIDFTLT